MRLDLAKCWGKDVDDRSLELIPIHHRKKAFLHAYLSTESGRQTLPASLYFFGSFPKPFALYSDGISGLGLFHKIKVRSGRNHKIRDEIG